MNWNDWEVVWKRQELPRGADADVGKLRETFEVQSRKLAKSLLVRDVAEASAGILVSVVMVGIWWRQGTAGWPIGLAIALTLGVTGVFLRERLRAHRARVGPEAPVLTRLEAEIAELQHQRRLLMGVWKWYLAPLGAAIVIVRLTIARSRPAWDIARDSRFVGAYFLFCALLFWLAWLMNRRAVRKRVEPRIAELEKLRSDLMAP
jgi:hypothetical protein